MKDSKTNTMIRITIKNILDENSKSREYTKEQKSNVLPYLESLADSDEPEYFLRFSNDIDVGTKPTGESYNVTPLGKYHYPLTPSFMEVIKKGTVPYMASAKYILLYHSPKENNFYFNNQNPNDINFNDHLDKLLKVVSRHSQLTHDRGMAERKGEISEEIGYLQRQLQVFEKEMREHPDLQAHFEYKIETFKDKIKQKEKFLEKLTQGKGGWAPRPDAEILGTIKTHIDRAHQDHPKQTNTYKFFYKTLEKLSLILSGGSSPRSSVLFAKMLREFGYKTIVDLGYSLIHHAEPEQSVFLYGYSPELVKSFKNSEVMPGISTKQRINQSAQALLLAAPNLEKRYGVKFRMTTVKDQGKERKMLFPVRSPKEDEEFPTQIDYIEDPYAFFGTKDVNDALECRYNVGNGANDIGKTTEVLSKDGSALISEEWFFYGSRTSDFSEFLGKVIVACEHAVSGIGDKETSRLIPIMNYSKRNPEFKKFLIKYVPELFDTN